MKKIIMGDIHGRDDWKQYKPHIFIGDFFDSFDIPFTTQLQNFLDIIRYKEENPDVILIVGNHDCVYLKNWGERYSGFQKYYQWDIRKVLHKYLDYFQIAYEWDNYLFTHAGLSKTWMNKYNCNSVEDVNELFKNKPRSFHFQGTDPYGDDVTQGPLWIRPDSLVRDGWGDKIQVVGHTEMDDVRKVVDGENTFYFIDNKLRKPLIIKV